MVLHLLALAREAGVEFSMADFEAVARRTPLLCDLKPGGLFSASELHEAGGVGALVRACLTAGTSTRTARRSPAGRSARRRRRPVWHQASG